MIAHKRSKRTYVSLGLLLVLMLFLVACGVTTPSWPGVTATDGRVYVAYGGLVTAVDIEERRQLWPYTGDGATFYAAPTVDDNIIYLSDYGQAGGMLSPEPRVGVYALEESGNSVTERWVNRDVITGHTFAQPLQVGEMLYVATSDNKIFALNAGDGSELWQFPVDNSVWGQPQYVDGTLYFASLDKTVYAVNASDGSEVWRRELSGANASPVVVADGRLFVSNFDGKVYALDIATSDELWSFEADDWVWGAPAVTENLVIFADLGGNVYALDAEAGELVWNQQARLKGESISAPTVVDGLVLFTTAINQQENDDTFEGYVAALEVADGALLWESRTAGLLYSSAVISNQTAVVAYLDEDEALRLSVFDLENGSELWNTPLSAE